MENKRELPSEEIKRKRMRIIKNMKYLTPLEPKKKATPSGLENGNGKTGRSGKLFEKIFVWNLPPVVTCPGISDWCRQNCYNADDRQKIYPIRQWRENLWWVLNGRGELKEKILAQLAACETKSTAVRIHSSGDFFSLGYIAFWLDIIRQNPKVLFWAYTRSWAVPELYERVIELGRIKNVSLLLSWDDTMKQPPRGFAKSIVYNSNEELYFIKERRDGVICPEQYNLTSCCADCGICINKPTRNIYFVLH